jgi:hypothetical protein
MDLGSLIALLKLAQDTGIVGKVQPVQYKLTQPVVLGDISTEEIALSYIEAGTGIPEPISVRIKTGRL